MTVPVGEIPVGERSSAYWIMSDYSLYSALEVALSDLTTASQLSSGLTVVDGNYDYIKILDKLLHAYKRIPLKELQSALIEMINLSMVSKDFYNYKAVTLAKKYNILYNMQWRRDDMNKDQVDKKGLLAMLMTDAIAKVEGLFNEVVCRVYDVTRILDQDIKALANLPPAPQSVLADDLAHLHPRLRSGDLYSYVDLMSLGTDLDLHSFLKNLQTPGVIDDMENLKHEKIDEDNKKVIRVSWLLTFC